MATTTKARLADVDAELVQSAEATLDLLFAQFFAATAKDQLLLRPQVEHAAQRVLAARLLLLAPGTIAADADVQEANRIRKQVEEAASTQELILGAARLIALFARF